MRRASRPRTAACSAVAAATLRDAASVRLAKRPRKDACTADTNQSTNERTDELLSAHVAERALLAVAAAGLAASAALAARLPAAGVRADEGLRLLAPLARPPAGGGGRPAVARRRAARRADALSVRRRLVGWHSGRALLPQRRLLAQRRGIG